MLSTLRIRDYALIESAEISFGRHFNVITGETGAGKSILLDALNLVLGERARSDEIRTGAEKVIIEAEFTHLKLPTLDALLAEGSIETSPTLLLRREVNRKGVSRSFINDTPLPLAALRRAGALLVDMHGQHEHQSLLDVATHLETLDGFARTGVEREKLSEEVRTLRSLTREHNELAGRKATAARERDLAMFQLKEITEVDPKPQEDELVERTLSVLEHAERITLLSDEIVGELYDGEHAVHDTLGAVKTKLEELAAIDPSLAALVEESKSALANIDDITTSLRTYAARIEYDPARIEALRERAMALKRLVKKYGSLDEVILLREKLSLAVMSDEEIDRELSTLQEKIETQRTKAGVLATALSSKRVAAAQKLEKAIAPIAGTLGFTYCNFETRFGMREAGANEIFCEVDAKKIALDEHGIDVVEFYLSVNQGEHARPLAEIASGGEISRIMLSLKTVFAASTSVPVMAFDEIDVGISGRIAQQVGQSMKDLAKKYQVIAITHLPQIAAQADTHFVVEKATKNGVTLSSIHPVTGTDREREVAKLLGGETISEANLKSARELMAS